jgi:hypothetical protein
MGLFYLHSLNESVLLAHHCATWRCLALLSLNPYALGWPAGAFAATATYLMVEWD